MLDTSINVKTEKFDGPLSLLLMLIQKEEMNIYDLNLTIITKQYLDYLKQMRELNFNVAGDYLYLAATLVLLKSRSCLNEEENENLLEVMGDYAITSQSELITRLEELQKFQKMGENLWKLPKLGHEVFTKPKVDKKSIINSILTPIDTEKLTLAMIELIQKNKKRFTVVRKDRISIKEKLEELKSIFKKDETFEFEKILGTEEEMKLDVTNIIISFISILELARLRKLSIYQNEDNATIYIKVLDSLENFDVDLANGFAPDDEEEQQEEKDEIVSEEIYENNTINQEQIVNRFEEPLTTTIQ